MQTHYERLGGEATLRQLTRRFYEIMDELPESYGIRKLHAENLANSEQKLFEFLSGWMGGPQPYIEKYGHPMLRRRHLNFKIGREERDQWLMCMKLALAEVVADAALREALNGAFFRLADHMRNQPARAANPGESIAA